jgi:hypothetical protein
MNVHILILSILCIMPNVMYGMGAGPGQVPGFPNLSPEEIQALEQELAQAAQAIDQYVSNLSPEEQAEFQRQVETVEQMMSSMNEEELNQFFETVIAQELANSQEMPPQPAAVPGAVLPIKEPVTIAPEKQKFTDEQQKVLTVLTSIIELTDAFLVKMQNPPDIDPKFTQWTQQGKLSSVTPGISWEEFKGSIDLFKKDLSAMRQTDTKTKKYLFLDALIKNEALYRALTDLEAQLRTHEPRVIVSSFGIERLNADTKTSIQKILNMFALTIKTTAEEIKKLFEAYEPEALKIREEEKKQIERVRAEGAQVRRPTPAGGVGGRGGYGDHMPHKQGAGGYGDYYGYPQGGGYGGSGYGGYGQQSQGGKPSEAKSPAKPAARGGGSSGKAKGKSDKEEAEKDKEMKDKDKGKGKKSEKGKEEGKKKKKKSSATCPTDPTTPEGILTLIQNNMDAMETLIDESSASLSNIMAAITEPGKPDDKLAIVTIPRLVRRAQNLNDLVAKYIAAAEATRTPAPTGVDVTIAPKKDAAKKATPEELIEKLVKELHQHPLFKEILPQLDTITAELKRDDDLIHSIPADKRFAYFGDKLQAKGKKIALNKPSEQVQKEYPKTSLSSLTELHTALDSVRTKLPKVAPKAQPLPAKKRTAPKGTPTPPISPVAGEEEAKAQPPTPLQPMAGEKPMAQQVTVEESE